MSEAEKLRDDLITWRTDMGTAEFTAALDALLAAVRAEERETLATDLDARAERWAHGHGVAGDISRMTDEEFMRAMKAAGRGCTVCARIELLSEVAAAIREGA